MSSPSPAAGLATPEGVDSGLIRRKCYVLGLGHPLLDVQANVTKKFLKKYDVEANGATLAGPRHKGLYKDLISNFDLEYVAGGCVQNTIRMIEWISRGSDHLETGYIGCIGDDKSGEILLSCMEATGVQTVYEVTDAVGTGACFVLITGSDRSLVTSLGAAASLSVDFLRGKMAWSMVESASLYYFIGYFVVTSMDCILAVADHAIAKKKVVSLNLGAPYVCRLFTERIDKLLPYVDFVFGTGSEAMAYAEAHKIKDRKSVEAAAKFIAGYSLMGKPRGHRLVVITQGPGPILLVSSEDMLVRTFEVCPILREDIVDTNGAGDAFAAGFLHEFITSGSLPDSVEAGKKAAAYIIKQSGFSLGPREEYQ